MTQYARDGLFVQSHIMCFDNFHLNLLFQLRGCGVDTAAFFIDTMQTSKQ